MSSFSRNVIIDQGFVNFRGIPKELVLKYVMTRPSHDPSATVVNHLKHQSAFGAAVTIQALRVRF